MELDLQSARIAREVETQIKTALSRLSGTAQKEVLERVAVDVLAALDANNGRPAQAKTVKLAAVVVEAKNNDNGSEPRLWERILTYCVSHPTPNNKYRAADVADVLIPASENTNRNSASSTIYTAVKRKCKGETEDFYFVWIGNGKFRLATQEERAEAQNAK